MKPPFPPFPFKVRHIWAGKIGLAIDYYPMIALGGNVEWVLNVMVGNPDRRVAWDPANCEILGPEPEPVMIEVSCKLEL